MVYRRLIARLDIKAENVVKGIHLEGLRIVGKPDEFASRYNEQRADELLYIDSVASLYGRNQLKHIITSASEKLNIPFCVGGGIRSLEDARANILNGADKISVNTAAVANPGLITEIAKEFGSQAVVLSVEAKREKGSWRVFVENGREPTGLDLLEWVKRAADAGAGEILLTSIDQEGTEKGFDLEMVGKVCEATKIPVIASGGAGSPKHVLDLFQKTSCCAVALASILHYGKTALPDLKAFLNSHGVPVRP